MWIPRCHVWHVRPDNFYFPRDRCGVCGAHKRPKLARCVFSIQHQLGFAVQIREENECIVIFGLLMELLGGVSDVCLLVLDFDHGGSIEC